MANSKRKWVMAGVAAAVLMGSWGYYILHAGQESTDDAVLETQVVTISPRVVGYITSLNVTDNQWVKKGDVIAQIDQRDYQFARDRAQGALESAKARLEASSQDYEATRISAPSNQDAAQARVNAAQATWENAVRTLKRMRALSDLARSKQQLDDAISAESNALAALNDTKARLISSQTAPRTIASAGATMKELESEVKQAEADLAQADKDLADTKILAPIEGKVTGRGVEAGNFVQVGQNLMSLVSPHVWVVANFKETQLSHMKVGQRTEIEVDAFPDLKLEGHVESIQSGTGARFSAFPAQNATGNFVKIVQRVPVKIVIEDSSRGDMPLGPGLSVIPTVHTEP